MPIYEYLCQSCAATFEVLQRSISATPVEPECRTCGSSNTRRRVSSVALMRPLGPGVGRAAYPTSWNQTNGGDPATVAYWQRRVEREMSQERSDPGLGIERGLAADRRWDAATNGAGSKSGAPEAPHVDATTSGHGHSHGPGAHRHGSESPNSASPNASTGTVG